MPDSDTENYAYNSAGELADILYNNPAGEEFGSIEYARDALGRASAQAGVGAELLAVELRDALDALGEILGSISPDDLLAKIFSRFCIGK